jgi:hypothetical protein
VFYYLPNFSRHQTINRPNEDDFNIPNAVLEKVLKESLINQGSIIDESVPIREDKISKEEDKRKGEPPDIVFPFLSTDFKELWDNWKIYKKNEFKKHYKTAQSEQAALKNLSEISFGDEETAKKIIQQSIANQWQGLFPLKTNHGKEKSNGKVDGQQLNAAFAKFNQRG